ncbi:MAG: hypothetical protein KAV87_28090 [Desulfobacteraceae bacterium]|nr:hypothetical protein [Desulfobacteraceae bacterium]
MGGKIGSDDYDVFCMNYRDKCGKNTEDKLRKLALEMYDFANLSVSLFKESTEMKTEHGEEHVYAYIWDDDLENIMSKWKVFIANYCGVKKFTRNDGEGILPDKPLTLHWLAPPRFMIEDKEHMPRYCAAAYLCISTA